MPNRPNIVTSKAIPARVDVWLVLIFINVRIRMKVDRGCFFTSVKAFFV